MGSQPWPSRSRAGRDASRKFELQATAPARAHSKGATTNVVLVIIDSLRRDHVGCYGNPWIRTPALDALAAESVRFTHAYPESLPTLEARQSIHTGNRLFPFRAHQSRKGDNVRWAGWHPIAEDQVTLAEIMAHAGYRTGLVTDGFHQFKPSMNFHRGFHQFEWIRGQQDDLWQSPTRLAGMDISHYLHPSLVGTPRDEELRLNLANVLDRRSEEDYFAPQVFRAAMRFLEDNRNDDFLLVVDSFDPHEPFDPPPWYWEPYDPGYGGRDITWPIYGPCDWMSPEEIAHTRALYAGEVTMVDKWLGRMVERMGDLALLDDTLLVVVSDHGHSLGERGIMGKLEDYQYPELVDIIMMIREPAGAGGGRVVEEFVYDHDILPTIAAWAGLELPRPVDGRDLWPLIAGREPGREFVTSGMGEYVRYQDREFHFQARNNGTEPLLFVLADDPGLEQNVAAQMPDVVSRLYAKIVADAGGPLPRISEVSQRRAGPWHERV
jgi:arylsulfatase A-like enzyme